MRERELVDDIAANAGRIAGDEAQDLHPSRVPDGFREGGQLIVGVRPLDGAEIGLLGGRPHSSFAGALFIVHRR